MKSALSSSRSAPLLALAALLSLGPSGAVLANDIRGGHPLSGSSVGPDHAAPCDGSASPCPPLADGATSCPLSVTRGLVSRYALDESAGLLAHDSVGGHHALLSPNTDWNPTGGAVGGALEFRSSGADFGLVANAIPLLTLDQFTYCSWIRPDGTGGGLFSSNSARWRGVYLESANPRRLGVLISTTDTAVIALSDAVIAPAVWHHVCATYNGSRSSLGILFYRNGAPLRKSWGRRGTGTTTASGDYIAEFGAMNSDGQRFTGSLDEILIYNRALAADEVARLHREYRACGAP